MTEFPVLPELRVGGAKDQLLSPFSKYYSGKVSIAKQPVDVKAVLPFVLVSDDGKLALVKNSKSGCTSLAKSIYYYNTGKAFDGNIHREGRHLRQGYSNWQENLRALESSNCFVVSAVREPSSRVISAFFDFVVEKRNPMRTHHLASFERFGLDEIKDLHSGFDAFLDMISQSISHNPWNTDRHWRPQILNLWKDNIEYGMVFRTEHFFEGFEKLKSELGRASDRLLQFHENRRSSTRDFVLTKQQAGKLLKIYQNDYEYFESLND